MCRPVQPSYLAFALVLGFVQISSAQLPREFPPQQAQTNRVPPTNQVTPAQGQVLPQQVQPQVVPQGQQNTGQSNGQQAQPPVQMQISPQVEALLQTWEEKTSGIKRMKGKFRRYVYDHIFLIEKRAIGQYWFESPDHARMDFLPDSELPKTQDGQPPTQVIGGKSFQIQADRGQTWLCTGDKIQDINHKEKTYDQFEIPVAYRGQNITNGPLPFLFGMKADEVKKRYVIALGDMHDPAQGKIHIVAYPLMVSLRREFQRAEVLLNQDYLPTGVKLWDPAGTKETVYVFWQPDVNFVKFPIISNPFDPNLRGYKLINNHTATADEVQREAIQPQNTKFQ